MIRRLYCEKCGQEKPLHPDDEAYGFKQRYLKFRATMPENFSITISGGEETTVIPVPHLVCDRCNAAIQDNEIAVAHTMWRGTEPEFWEQEYGFKPI